MANSTKGSTARKPRKTTNVLTARGDGRWCKRYTDKAGTRKWFYTRGTEQESLDEWNRVKADLLAGRTPGDANAALTLRDLCNRFLEAKTVAMEAGDLSGRTFASYKRTTDLLIDVLGMTTIVSQLRPDDFQTLFKSLAAKHGVYTRGREITIVRGVFKYAFDADLIEKPVKFGPSFKLPSKKAKRRRRNKNKRERGKRMFGPDEIKRMLAAAGPQMKAMILLGINGGLGNADCASLHLSHLDIASGWLDFPRPKTEIDRKIPLWPETVAALKAVLAKRPQPKNVEHAGLVFLTAKQRQPWVRFVLEQTTTPDGKTAVVAKGDDAIAKRMRKLLDTLGIYRKGVTFYALRHSFETIAGGSHDQVAVDTIMGHADASMAAEYRENIEDSRLQRVVDHVRTWLYGGSNEQPQPEPKPANAYLRVVG